MAEFKAGDRVVKMSGIGAGKYGTVNSVMENGTLNVTFDGERLPKYCDPALCGQVAANAKFRWGDRVKDKHGNRGIVVGIQDDDAGPFGSPPSKYGAILRIKTDDGKTGYLEEANASLANSRAANSAAADKGRKLLSGTRGEGYVATMEKELAAGKSEGLKHDIRVASHYAEHGTPEGKEFHKAVLVYLKELGRKYGINSAAANAVSNASYRNSHSYFVIAPGIKDHCILSGWDNREDAEYAAADLRKRGVGCSVARRQLLEMSGVDPDVEKSWKGNHVPNAAANAVARNAGESAHFKLFQGMARAAVGEILYAAEGELRALTGKAKECADAARAQGDAKTVSDIARVLSLLKDAVRKHHSDCLRTIG